MKTLRVFLVALVVLAAALPATGAELLVRAFDSFEADPESDRLTWKIGYVITVQPDGHPWSPAEGPPKNWIIKVSGMTVAEAEQYLLEAYDLTGADAVVTRLRKWKLDTTKMTGAVRNKLTAEGTLSVTRTQALNFMGLTGQ